MPRALASVAVELPVAIVIFSVTVTLLATSLGLLVVLPVAVVFIWLLFVVVAGFGRLERSRVAALVDADVAYPHPPLTTKSWWRRLLERARTPSRWREIVYMLVGLPVNALSFSFVVAAWAGSLALSLMPVYVNSLPGHTAEFGLFDLGMGPGVWIACAIGALGVLLGAPWLTLAAGAIDRGLAERLLAPSRSERDAAAIARIDASRVAALDSAEAERRRIERDLHDGAQQRLVKLGMDLGMAHDRFETDPDGARQLVSEAHEEAKAALADLRDLVRGFHPAILEDRGLDAALSSVVARSPVPVDLRVEVSPRPSPAVESAAYFVIVEALTNVAKHADATAASVSVKRGGDRLAIDVTDNGRGGADAANGSGLAGLAERVHAVGGWMQVLSPNGGPTSVIVELPCGS